MLAPLIVVTAALACSCRCGAAPGSTDLVDEGRGLEEAWELPWGLSIDALAASRRHSRDTSPQSALSQARRALLQRHFWRLAQHAQQEQLVGGRRRLDAPMHTKHK